MIKFDVGVMSTAGAVVLLSLAALADNAPSGAKALEDRFAEVGTALTERSHSDQQLLGVFCGNSPDDVKQFEAWLGRKVDGVLGYVGHQSWDDFDGSAAWAVGHWGEIDRRILWSVPLIPKDAALAKATSGEYDDHYRKVATILSKFRPQEPVLYVRTGWEFNGDWFPWSAHGKSSEFIGAFRRFATIFREVSPRFKFEWNVNIGEVGMDPESAYPGDDYVDIIGMDFYWKTEWDPKEAKEAFNYMVNRKWGLKWHQAFAAAHDKPTAYSEWGVMTNDSAAYIENVSNWFASHPVIYQTYWNSDVSFKGKLSDGRLAVAGSSFKAAFGPR